MGGVSRLAARGVSLCPASRDGDRGAKGSDRNRATCMALGTEEVWVFHTYGKRRDVGITYICSSYIRVGIVSKKM